MPWPGPVPRYFHEGAFTCPVISTGSDQVPPLSLLRVTKTSWLSLQKGSSTSPRTPSTTGQGLPQVRSPSETTSCRGAPGAPAVAAAAQENVDFVVVAPGMAARLAKSQHRSVRRHRQGGYAAGVVAFPA